LFLIVCEFLGNQLEWPHMNTTYQLSGAERQNQIVELLSHNERLTVTGICKTFSISEATARRDLDALAEQGLLQRVHGGAIPVRRATPEAPILERGQEQAEEKRRIGRGAAELVKDGETIFLGSGTTVLEVAKNLRERKDLTVITNSLPVINMLVGLPDISMVVPGGLLRDSELSFIGHITEKALAEVRADTVIIGIRGLSLEAGMTNDYLPETLTDRAILSIGGKVVIVADHTKCGVISTAFVAPLTRLQTLVTDDKTDPNFITALEQQGIRILQV
jgi:DeoR family transcriptional regulator, aga operon transcriptional repressor